VHALGRVLKESDTFGAGDIPGNATFVGGFGTNLIFTEGLAGDDLVFGNEGNDSILVDPGSDTVFGSLGNGFILQNATPPRL
jgi:Ca2+-binding RTX toxin-like protein